MHPIDRKEVLRLWETCTPDKARQFEISNVVKTLLAMRSRYETVQTATNVPWYVTGCIHYRESDFSLSLHLANGDPLWNSDGKAVKTVNEPKGLGPFQNWEEGAIAALHYDELDKIPSWGIVDTLIELEAYNGFGYRKFHHMPSPYIWAASNNYSSGKYSEDGRFKDYLVDAQIGCAVILKLLEKSGVDITDAS